MCRNITITVLVLLMLPIFARGRDQQYNADIVPEAIAKAVDVNDRYTAGHFRRVAQYSRMIAECMGYEILKKISIRGNFAYGAKWHHERIDGKGYPDGLQGEEIPEIARIIAIADAYDAMTSKRSYRGIMSQEQVREQIVMGKGSQFDDKIASIMVSLIDKDTDYRMKQC